MQGSVGLVIIKREKDEEKRESDFERKLLQKEMPEKYRIGIAVDVGTTTIDMTVIDFYEKKIVGKSRQKNSQTMYGADVMMRIMHAVRGMQETLHEMLCQQIETMAEDILKKSVSETGRRIKNEAGNGLLFCVVGNPTILHLFLNKEVGTLSGYPFAHAYHGKIVCTGKDISFQKYPAAKVKVFASICAHVGGDALAVVARKKLHQSRKVKLAVDFGTNAEMILSCNGTLLVCSAASGPALEGKGIQCGMIAKAGAITDIRLAKNTGNVVLTVLEADKAKGICGSGLIHLLAELRKKNILQEDGYLPAQEEWASYGIAHTFKDRLVKREGQRAFLLCEETDSNRELYVLQSDIRSIQTALASIKTGIEIMLKRTGIGYAQIHEVLLAGALGEHMKEDGLIETGLFPDVWRGKIHPIGNAAKEGAMLGLIEDGLVEAMEKEAEKIKHIELANDEMFQSLYLSNMNFKK